MMELMLHFVIVTVKQKTGGAAGLKANSFCGWFLCMCCRRGFVGKEDDQVDVKCVTLFSPMPGDGSACLRLCAILCDGVISLSLLLDICYI